MTEKRYHITCAFCKGSGQHPYYHAPCCPVCKGKGLNEVAGSIQICRPCRGSGRKSTTTLTCYNCGGRGVLAGGKDGLNLSIIAHLVDEETIKKIVEQTIQKYQIMGNKLREDEPEGGAVSERIPIVGKLRDLEEYKPTFQSVRGEQKTSAQSIDATVASLRNLKKIAPLAGDSRDKGHGEQRDTEPQDLFHKTSSLLARLKTKLKGNGS